MLHNNSNRRYLIARNGKQIFDVDTQTLVQYWKVGKIQPTDHYWTNGMSSWWEVSKLPIISNHVQQNNLTTTSSSNIGVTISAVTQSTLSGVSSSSITPKQNNSPTHCPNCNSKTIRTARAIYLSGTRDSTTYGHSYGWGRRSSPRSYSSQRTSKSRLAAQLAPPEAGGCGTSIFKLIIALIGLAIITVTIVMGNFNSHSPSPLPSLLTLGISGLILWGIYRVMISDFGQSSDIEFQKQMEEYDRTWYCNKCATKFIC